MSFVAPSTAVDPALAALFASRTGSSHVPGHQLQRSSAFTVEEVYHNRKEAARPNKPPSKLQRQHPVPVEAQEEYQLQSPTDQKILELFERIRKNRPSFIFLPGDMRKTLETQLNWNVERERIIRLWGLVTQLAAYKGGAPAPSSSDENDLQQNHILQSDNMSTPPISEEQAILTIPTNFEIMTFLWEFEQDNPRITKNTHDLTVLMKHQKYWHVSEDRLDRVLIEMDQADMKDVFAMPTTSTYASLSEEFGTADASLASGSAAVETTPTDLAMRPAASVQTSSSKKQRLRNTLHSRVLAQRPEHACKITDMLLELDSSELSTLLEDDDALFVRIDRLFHLYVHYADSHPTRAESGGRYLDSDASSQQMGKTRV